MIYKFFFLFVVKAAYLLPNLAETKDLCVEYNVLTFIYQFLYGRIQCKILYYRY